MDDVGKQAFGSSCNHIGCSWTVIAHTHIERTIQTERKAATGRIELHRGDANIHDNAVNSRNTFRRANSGEVGKTILDQCQPARRTVDQFEPTGDRCRIAVNADHPRALDLEDRARVPAGTERGVDVDAVRPGREKLDRLFAEHGNMAQGSRGHAPAPVLDRREARKLDANGPIAPQIDQVCGTSSGESPPRSAAGSEQPRKSLLSARRLLGWHLVSRAKRKALGLPIPVWLFTT
jgi:hypothetical protein